MLILLGGGLLAAGNHMPASAQQSDPRKTVVPADPAKQPDSATRIDKLIKYLDGFGKGAIMVFEGDASIPDVPDFVVLPPLKYELMRQKMEADKSAEDWTVTRVGIKGILGDDQASVEAIVGVRVDNPGGAVIDLKMPQVVNCSRCTDTQGNTPRLERAPGGPFRIVVDRQGDYTYTLDLTINIERSPTGRRLRLSLPAAPVKNVELTGQQELVGPQGSESGLKFAVGDDGRTFRPPLRTDESLDVTWQTVDDKKTGSFSAFSVVGDLRYTLDSYVIDTVASLTIDARSESREWTFWLPAGEAVRSVAATKDDRALVVEADVSGDSEKELSRLRVRFAKPVSGQVQLRVVTYRKGPAPQNIYEVGRFELEDAVSQTGKILLFVGPSLSVNDDSTVLTPSHALRKMTAMQLESNLQKLQPALVFHYSTQPSTVQLQLQAAKPVVAASTNTRIDLSTDRAEIFTLFHFSIRRANVDRLKLELPIEMRFERIIDGAELVSVEDERVDASMESREITMALAEPRTGEFNIGILASQPIQLGEVNALRLPMPAPDMECTGTVEAVVPKNCRVTIDAGRTRGLIHEPAPETVNPLSATTLYFRRQQRSTQLAFRVEQLPRRADAAIKTVVRQEAAGMSIQSTITIQAENKPLEEITLQIPDGAEGLVVQGDELAGELVVESGPQRFRLTEPRDDCTINIEYRFPFLQRDAYDVLLPLVLPVNVDKIDYRASIWCERGLVPVASGPWTPAAPTTHFEDAEEDRPGLVVSSASPQTPLRLQLEPTATLASFVVPRIAVDDMIANDGKRQGSLYILVGERRASVVTVHIPFGCKLSEIRVNTTPVAPILHDLHRCQVRLPRDHRPCSLEIDYGFSEIQELGAWSSLAVTVPTIVEDAAIGEVRWRFRVERDRLLMRFSPGVESNVNWNLWRFWQPFLTDREPTIEEWLREVDANVDWSPPRSTSGRRWLFQTWSNADNIELLAVRESFWVLLCSGVILVTVFSIFNLSLSSRIRATGILLTVALAVAIAAPHAAAWVWLGAQWGVYLAVVTIAGNTWVARRPPFSRRAGRVLAPTKMPSRVTSMSSLLRHSIHPEAGSAASEPVGSTIDSD